MAAKVYPLLVPDASTLSMRHAVVELGVQGETPPRLEKCGRKTDRRVGRGVGDLSGIDGVRTNNRG